jgi:hypothetical protein
VSQQRSNCGRAALGLILIVAGSLALVVGALALYFVKGKKTNTEDIASAEKIAALHFTRKERRLMVGNLRENAADYRKMRQVPLPDSVPPAVEFSPILPGMTFPKEKMPPYSLPENNRLERPADLEELAFWPVTSLAQLIRSRQVSSVELTGMYIQRLKKYGPRLECVITLTEDLAMAQARRADEEIVAGRYRGPLHGIPWGAKDLLDTKGIKTTWGSRPFANRVPETNATVVDRLEEAGAVLVAKLTMGELAWGDVWFGGKTRNPWNYEQGSSGSSAGSAAATAGSAGTAPWP